MSKVNLNDLKARIDAADVYALAKRTPCQLAPKLSAEHGRNIWLKREDLQDVFSFKIRGAANRIAGLTDAEKAKGCLLYTSPSPRDKRQSRMPSSA